jgi:hypothetical protein
MSDAASVSSSRRLNSTSWRSIGGRSFRQKLNIARFEARSLTAVEFTDLGEHDLKNISRPIRAYAIGLQANTIRAAPPTTSAPRACPS